MKSLIKDENILNPVASIVYLVCISYKLVVPKRDSTFLWSFELDTGIL